MPTITTPVDRIAPIAGLSKGYLNGLFEFETDAQALAFVAYLVTANALGAYSGLAAASQAEMEAGTQVLIRSMSPLRVAQLVAALAPKTVAQIAGLQGALDAKAPLASPALSGTPTVPTAAGGTNTTQAASTAFVASAIAALVNGAPGTLDALNELATAINNDPSFAATMATALGNKAPLISPALTGTPTAPTPASADNSTKIATTAYVDNAVSGIGGGSSIPLRGVVYLEAMLNGGNDSTGDGSIGAPYATLQAAWTAKGAAFAYSLGKGTVGDFGNLNVGANATITLIGVGKALTVIGQITGSGTTTINSIGDSLTIGEVVNTGGTATIVDATISYFNSPVSPGVTGSAFVMRGKSTVMVDVTSLGGAGADGAAGSTGSAAVVVFDFTSFDGASGQFFLDGGFINFSGGGGGALPTTMDSFSWTRSDLSGTQMQLTAPDHSVHTATAGTGCTVFSFTQGVPDVSAITGTSGANGGVVTMDAGCVVAGNVTTSGGAAGADLGGGTGVAGADGLFTCHLAKVGGTLTTSNTSVLLSMINGVAYTNSYP